MFENLCITGDKFVPSFLHVEKEEGFQPLQSSEISLLNWVFARIPQLNCLYYNYNFQFLI